ncbi:hypothetical protein [Flavobacterium beibuense]|uniref:Lipoprotein n=1 Tax=Flavobacterium beibuense TaxID=657326 RepID=A0A444WF72_9FLAO|nr:hypothetical protein [Flavobacterium beibuense]RYJ44469.1 hypothetical protein NU09_1079 [Flavobacterium beibuense]
MKKAMYFASLAMLGTAMVSCSNNQSDNNETNAQEVTAKQADNRKFDNLGDGIAKGLAASFKDMDFSKLFVYNNTAELKTKSDKTFAEMITEARDLIEEREDITDLVSTIEIKAGEAHLKELIFLENSVKKDIVVYKDRNGVEEKSSGVYSTPSNFTLLTNDLENNSTVVSDYLTNNLKTDGDSFTFELRVSAGKASVYVYKA